MHIAVDKTLRDTWKSVMVELQQMMKPTEFMTWFENTVLENIEDGKAIIATPLDMTQKRLQTKHKSHIIKAFEIVGTPVSKVEITVDNTLNKEDERVISLSSVKQISTKIKRRSQVEGVRLSESISSRLLNPKYSFDNFIVGPNNQLAHAAFQAAAKKPGSMYNPLFVYGGVGLWKTHLLQATGNLLTRENRDSLIIYTTSEKFTSELVAAIQGGTKSINKWQKDYRKVDVLIIDDIQFIAGKQRTQEELFHIFNILREAGKQIIFSSDRPPKEIKNLDDRLVSRFESGMIVDIEPPDFETRTAILQQKAQDHNVFIPHDVLEFIAYNVMHSIRELEGVLTQFAAQVELMGIEPSIEMAEGVLRRSGNLKDMVNPRETYNYQTAHQGYKKEQTEIDEDYIIDLICDYFHVERVQVLGTSRKKEVMVPRQMCMLFLKHELGYSLERIWEAFGGKNHTTVMHAIRKIENDTEVFPDWQIAKDMRNIRYKLSD